MKIPRPAPTLEELFTPLSAHENGEQLVRIITSRIGPAPKGKYRHWDVLRSLAPPEGLSTKEWWAGIKMARGHMKRVISLLDEKGIPFSYCLADPVLELLHEIDSKTTGPVETTHDLNNPGTRERYLQTSIIEEAISSSLLEGAATTRREAQKLIRSGREPRDISERMILNNYQAIKEINKLTDQPLSIALVESLHETITKGTLEAEAQAYREEGDGIGVYDNEHNHLLYSPPSANELPRRMAAMCKWFNQEKQSVFLHPVIKSIILHFWLAYEHPFKDGNGRAARSLFYWSMLKQGYWMYEFISISSIIKKSPAKYAKAFLYTETDENDLTYFLLSQLETINVAIDELNAYIKRKSEGILQVETQLNASASLNIRQAALLSSAQRHPGTRYTIRSHKTSQRIAYQTARTDLLELEALGFLIRGKSGREFTFSVPSDLVDRIKNSTGT